MSQEIQRGQKYRDEQTGFIGVARTETGRSKGVPQVQLIGPGGCFWFEASRLREVGGNPDREFPKQEGGMRRGRSDSGRISSSGGRFGRNS